MRVVSGLILGLCLAVPANAADPQSAATMTDDQLIANAVSAAPRAVGEMAAVVAVNDKGEMRSLREAKGGSNFTCIPDNPASPANDPMCLDQNGLLWAQAWMSQQEPPQGKPGFGYMLQGGADASNTDPFAKEPKSQAQWVETGPHVMVFNAPAMAEGYPTQGDNPDTKAPFVMWAGTPYAHLMIPVGTSAEATAELPAE